MESEWPLQPLDSLVTIHDSKRKPIKKSERKAGPYPYYGASDIADYVDSYAFDGLYLLLSEDGDNLRTRNTPIAFTASGKFWVNNHAHVLQGSDDLDTIFLCYALQYAEIDSYISGSTRPKITQTDLKKIPVRAPSMKVRHAIAEFVYDFDNKISLNRQINQTLEQMAQALFKSWFVDFDPVIDNALDAGNPIPDALAERAACRQDARASDDFQPLPDDVRQLFPSEFEESELGWIPKGWNDVTLHDLVESKSVTYPLKSVKEVVFLNTGDIENGQFLHRNISKVDGLPGQAKKSIKEKDILFSEIRPKNKRFAFVDFNSEQYVVSTKLMVLRAKAGIEPELPYFLLTLEKTTDELQRIAELRSGTFPQITFSELAFINFSLPSNMALIEKFVSQTLKPFYRRVSQLAVENSSLESLRDTLLPKLISGELRLDSVEVEQAKSLLDGE
ncbi:hypothetical protein GCM10009112_23760 [Marinomonas arenicola]|uniref:restriction endonuclease subunit S n=1 Tax=Marinomonas TaxID=28253 RepID=UPI001056775A|nr:restriction endonuclease subunit S [Marinomonas sp. KMM3893]